jgi:hypothetical protein
MAGAKLRRTADMRTDFADVKFSIRITSQTNKKICFSESL